MDEQRSDTLDEQLPLISGVGPLLRTMGLYSYRDLLSFDVSCLDEIRGVGRKKVEAVGALKVEAMRRAGYETLMSEESEPAPLEAWIEDDLDPRQALGPLTGRLQSLFDVQGFSTIGELRTWVSMVRIQDVQNYGKSTDLEIRHKLQVLHDCGPDQLIFGGDAPSNILDAANMFLQCLNDDVRMIFCAKYIDNKSLVDIGSGLGITRERVRQIIERNLRLYRASWSPRMRELLRDGYNLFDVQGSFVLTSTLMSVLKEPPQWAAMLCIDILNEDSIFVNVYPEVSTNLSATDANALRDELRESLDALLREHANMSEVIEMMGELGLYVPVSDVPLVLDLLAGVILHNGRIYSRRHRVRAAYIHALREVGGPATLQAVTEQVAAVSPEFEPSIQKTLTCFSNAVDVFAYDRNRWVHIANLPFDLQSLERCAQRCLPLVEQAQGAGVAVPNLLAWLATQGESLPGLTARILRDALIRTGLVRGWRAGSQVAWRGGEVRRKTLHEQIAAFAQDAPQPFDISDMIDVLISSHGFESSSVLARVNSAPDLLVVGQGKAFCRQVVFPDDADFVAARDLIFSHVSVDDLCTIPQIMLSCPQLEPIAQRFGLRALWAVARSHPDLDARYRGTFLWRREFSDSFWGAFLRAPYGVPVVLKPIQLQNLITTNYLVPTASLEYYLIREACESGLLLRIIPGLYLRIDVPYEVQYEALAATPMVIQLALNSPDLVRESPARELLNRLRVARDAPPL